MRTSWTDWSLGTLRNRTPFEVIAGNRAGQDKMEISRRRSTRCDSMSMDSNISERDYRSRQLGDVAFWCCQLTLKKSRVCSLLCLRYVSTALHDAVIDAVVDLWMKARISSTSDAALPRTFGYIFREKTIVLWQAIKNGAKRSEFRSYSTHEHHVILLVWSGL